MSGIEHGRERLDALSAPPSPRRERALRHFAAVARDSTLLGGLRAVGMLASFVLTVLLARVLSPQQFGAVSIAFSLSLIGARIVTANIDAAAMRFVPRYQASNDRSGITAYVALGRKLLLYGSGAIGAGLLLAWAGTVLRPGGVTLPLHFAAGAAAAPLFGWLRLRSATVAALGHVLLAAVPEYVIRPLLMLALTAAALLFWPDLGAFGVLTLYFLSTAAVCVLLGPLFRRAIASVPANARGRDGEERRRWIGAGLDLLIPTLFLELSVNTIILIASVVLPTDQVAVLTIALRIQAVVLFGVTSINMVVAPRIARSLSTGDGATVNDLLFASTHLKLWPALLLAGFLPMFGEPLLAIFGPEYAAALLPLITLCAIPVIMAVFGPVVLFVTVLELERVANRVFQLAFAALAILVPMLGYHFGVQGAAVAVVAVWLAWHVALYRMIRARTRYSTVRLTPRQAA